MFNQLQVQTEPGTGQERPYGVSNVPPPRLPTAEEVENFPPDAKPIPRNPLPPFKDPSLQSPAKKGPPVTHRPGAVGAAAALPGGAAAANGSAGDVPRNLDAHNTNSRNSENLMDADFAS